MKSIFTSVKEVNIGDLVIYNPLLCPISGIGIVIEVAMFCEQPTFTVVWSTDGKLRHPMHSKSLMSVVGRLGR